MYVLYKLQERVFNGKNYIMEEAITGDFAIVKVKRDNLMILFKFSEVKVKRDNLVISFKFSEVKVKRANLVILFSPE